MEIVSMNGDEIVKALSWRSATKAFDPAKKISETDLHTILESARLSPSSFGIEAWKFIVVENTEVRTDIRAAAWDQPKVTDASHLVVIARRTDARANIVNELIERTAKIQGVASESLDGLKQMVGGSISHRSDESLDVWVRAQAYIPLGIMIESASLLGIDSGPMEGFDPLKVGDLLGLKEKNLSATTMLALGYRLLSDETNRPKVRRAFNEVVEFVK